MKYEVKFLLDAAKVLDDFGELTACAKDCFHIRKQEEIAVQFLDTKELAFKEAGWVIRLRNKEEEKAFVLTFKKRFDVAGDQLEVALDTAKAAGFSLDGNYEAEVDWGYERLMLSFSLKKELPNKSYEQLELPDLEAALSLLEGNLPKKLLKEMGDDLITTTHLHGPLVYTKYKGKFKGEKITVEIWPVKEGPLVEISFKGKKYKEVASYRKRLLEALEKKGWLLHEESLKTVAVLEK